jgi:hypothetical protein
MPQREPVAEVSLTATAPSDHVLAAQTEEPPRLVSVKELYSVDQQRHGNGRVYFKWNAAGTLVASVGSSRMLYICDSAGNLVDRLSQLPIRCSALGWSADGRVLAAIQEHAKEVIVWQFNGRHGQNSTQLLDLGSDSDTLFLAWSTRLRNSTLAVGVTRGRVTFIPQSAHSKSRTIAPTQQMQQQMQKAHMQSKRVVPPIWSELGLLAFVAEDHRHVTCYSGVLEQVTCCFKVRARITAIQWGSIYQTHEQSKARTPNLEIPNEKDGSVMTGSNHDVLSICVDAKCLVTYVIGYNGHMESTQEVDSDDEEAAASASNADPNAPVVLEFEPSYGSIVAHTWLGNGRVLCGLANGALAISCISSGDQHFVDVSSKGQTRLKLVEHSSNAKMVAACFEDRVVVLDTAGWGEVCVLEIPRAAGRVVGAQWTRGGRIFSVSTDGGCLLHFTISATKWVRGGRILMHVNAVVSEVLEAISCMSLLVSMLSTMSVTVLAAAFAYGVGVLDVFQALAGMSLIL